MTSKTWWGEKFIEALTRFMDQSRLARGRAYRSDSRLSKYVQNKNVVTATVRGNANPYFGVHKTPYYKTKIEFKALDDPKKMLNEMSQDPLVLAKLITRELPLSISNILPQSKKDMTTSCSCPDWENPCKHIAGLYLKIAEEIDYNPLLIFELRGISSDQLEEGIKEFMTPVEKPSQNERKKQKKIPKKIDPKDFWGVPQKIPEPSQSFAIPCILIKKAGVNPPFWHKKKPFIEVADLLYKSIHRSWKKMLKK